MKYKYFFAIFFCMLCFIALSQTDYRNNWIDYSNTYYKFSLGTFGNNVDGTPIKNGLARISGQTLAAAGLGNIEVQNLQLWRNGVQVPVYTSKSAGVLSAADYVEFWGEANDGVMDKDLYNNADYQLSDYYSVQTDSAAYFITYNKTGNNKRLQETANNTATTSLKPDANFMYTVGRHYRNRYNEGYNIVIGTDAIISSEYDKGEGWFSDPFNVATPLSQTFAALAADASGPSINMRVNLIATAYYTRSADVYLNGEKVGSKSLTNYDYGKISVTGIDPNKIANNTALITVKDVGAGSKDQMMVAKIEMDYSRRFDFGNATSFSFKLAASSAGRLINITNFSAGNAAPVLYDLVNGKRYTADVSVTGTYSFLLLPSTVDYNLVLVRGDGSTVTNITNISQRNFVDYSKAANQGDYIIISNPLIYGSGASNYVEQYRAYRSSPDGGAYKGIVVNVEDLIDQFAYGIKKHPLSIKNFLRYARNTFTTKPSYTLLIGKGVIYTAYRSSQLPAATNEQLNLVPTWGSPGSDNLLASPDGYNPIPLIPIGRISAVSAAEVGDYLAKVKHYEALQKTSSTASIADKAYMKKVIQIAGGNDVWLNDIIAGYTTNYAKIISDTFFGAESHNFIQSSDPSQYAKAVVSFKDVYESGSSIVEYFGHASSTSIDFGLDNPASYNVKGRYPMFIVNGCLAGNIFDLDANRLTQRSTLSEKFVLEPENGSIGYISSTSWGIVSICDYLTQKLYESISKTKYGQGFGNITADAFDRALNPPGLDSKMDDFYTRYQSEGLAYHGDPAIKLSPYQKPDYALDSDQLTLQSQAISVADNSYQLQVKLYNLGMAAKDSVHLMVYRKYANADTSVVFSKNVAVNGVDSLLITLPIVPNRDTGTQYVYAYIDDKNAIAEENENNNIAFIPVHIYNGDIRPVYPYNFSIINNEMITLSASTANPLTASEMYTMEMDTTALFNSPVKIMANNTSLGGVVQFTNIALPLNAVYYWRVAEAGTNYWNQFSFRHDGAANFGAGQSHYFQHTKSAFANINIDSSRQFNFDSSAANLYIQQGVYPYSTQDGDFSIMLNGLYIAQSACVGSSIIFNIFDGTTMNPIPNKTNPFGAAAACKTLAANNYEFSTQTAASRQNAYLFLQSLPAGTLVVARRVYDMGNADFAPVWRADSALYHSDVSVNGITVSKANTLYQTFKDYGLPIDDYSYPRTFVFIYKKGDTNGFKPIGSLSAGVTDKVTLSVYMPTLDTTGYVTSPQFGPAAAWNTIKWNGYSANNNNNKNVTVIGVNNAGVETTLYTLDSTQKEFNISGVNATQYPYIKLKMKNQDALTSKPYQLAGWSAGYQPAAEGGMAPNLGINIPEYVNLSHSKDIQFDTLQGYVVFKNVSLANFKPLKIKASLTDAANNVYNYDMPKSKALAAGDTMHASFMIDVRSLPQGRYNLELQVNPDNDQAEQYTFNNWLYKYVVINRGVVALPVQLLNFIAAKKANNQVGLEWQVAEEINVDRYEVQAGTDGQHFTTIGTVKAFGSKAYNCLHTSPANGKNYYRLKMVDKDGAFTYSPVRWVDMLQAAITTGPNPFTNYIKISVNGTGKYTAKLYSAAGQLLMQKTFSGTTVMDTQSLAAGTYTVQVSDATTNVKTAKLQKQQE